MMGVYGGSRLNQKINFFQKQKNLSRKLMKILLFFLETESEKFGAPQSKYQFSRCRDIQPNDTKRSDTEMTLRRQYL